VVEQAPAWAAPVVVGVLMLLALTGAWLDAALAAGRPRLAVPFQETARLLVQQRRTTTAPDPLLWRMGGASLLVVACLMIAVVPWGGWTMLDSPVGVVWFNAMDVLLWAALWCAGWGANSAWPLVGGHRFLAQALAYELPLMFALISPALAAGSLRMADVQAAQDGLWFVVLMPVAFAVLLISVLAFSVWGPFSSPMGRDLGGAVLAETSGVDRLLVLVGRYALLAAGAAVAVPLFLGGGGGPVLPPVMWSVVKTVTVLALLVATRRRFALLRPERFAELAWLVGMPLVLLQVLIVAVYVLVTS
jgi:NADH-quinone oxidoreductase subunit H